MNIDSSQAFKRVMIVDDEVFFRGLLRDILEEEGFTVVAEAADGVEAIEKYKLHRPDITFMDIFMPNKNGIDATREIVSSDRNANVLICSGVGFDTDVDYALQAGARDIVYKPFSSSEIMEAIYKLMGAQQR